MIRNLLIFSIVAALISLVITLVAMFGRAADARTRNVGRAQLVLIVGMLVGTVPRLLWPAADNVNIAASLISVACTVTAMVLFWRGMRRAKSTS